MGSRTAASSLAREVTTKDDDFDVESSDSSDDEEAEAPTSSSPAAAEASKFCLRLLIEHGVQDLEDPHLVSFLQEESEIVIGTWIQQLLVEHDFLNEFEDIDGGHNLDQGDEDSDSDLDSNLDLPLPSSSSSPSSEASEESPEEGDAEAPMLASFIGNLIEAGRLTCAEDMEEVVRDLADLDGDVFEAQTLMQGLLIETGSLTDCEDIDLQHNGQQRADEVWHLRNRIESGDVTSFEDLLQALEEKL